MAIGAHRSLSGSLLLAQAAGEQIAVIIIDENNNDANPSGDRALCHQGQATVLGHAVANQWPIFATTMGFAGNMAYTEAYGPPGNWGAVLNAAIPAATLVYHKGGYEPDGFANTQLTTDFTAGNFDHVVIMGQSVNACCAATARTAAALGARVHTSRLIVRGGGVATAALSRGVDWPADSIFHLVL